MRIDKNRFYMNFKISEDFYKNIGNIEELKVINRGDEMGIIEKLKEARDYYLDNIDIYFDEDEPYSDVIRNPKMPTLIKAICHNSFCLKEDLYVDDLILKVISAIENKDLNYLPSWLKGFSSITDLENHLYNNGLVWRQYKDTEWEDGSIVFSDGRALTTYMGKIVLADNIECTEIIEEVDSYVLNTMTKSHSSLYEKYIEMEIRYLLKGKYNLSDKEIRAFAKYVRKNNFYNSDKEPLAIEDTDITVTLSKDYNLEVKDGVIEYNGKIIGKEWLEVASMFNTEVCLKVLAYNLLGLR